MEPETGFQVLEIGLKEERRVLGYASDGLKAKVGCLGKPLWDKVD